MPEYKMVVLVKQVPDTKNITGEAMKADGTVNRAALPAVFNPEDLHALEMALQVREKYGGTVTVISMGPPSAVEVLKDALYRGADRVFLISDRAFAGSDTLATSFALKQAIQTKFPDVDIVFCGRQAIDGDTAQVGPQTAEKLDIAQVTYVESIEHLEKKKIKVMAEEKLQSFEMKVLRFSCYRTSTPWSLCGCHGRLRPCREDVRKSRLANEPPREMSNRPAGRDQT